MSKATTELKEALSHIKDAEQLLTKVLLSNYGLRKEYEEEVIYIVNCLNKISDNSKDIPFSQSTLKEIIAEQGNTWDEKLINEPEECFLDINE